MKEALPEVATWLCKNEGGTIQQAIEALGLKSITREDLERLVGEIVEGNKDLIRKHGEKSYGPLMGLTMNKLRGKADPAVVSRILKEKIGELAE
jgi:glutamyl-tRNA(Gln) amidotransferase subunit E